MINQDLKETLKQKIQEGDFTAADIAAYLTLFCDMGNAMDDLQDEVQGWDRRINLVFTGADPHWMIVAGGQFSAGEGTLEDADLILTLAAEDAVQLFAGELDAQDAFMSGALKVNGALPDALIMRTLIELVGEEIEY